MKIGTGYFNSDDGRLSGKMVAENAIENGKIDQADLVLGFCGGQVDHDEYFQGLQSVIGDNVPIIGGSAIGIITNNDLSYEGFPAGAMIIESDKLQHQEVTVGEIDKNEKLAGKKLGEKLSVDMDGRLILIFYDSIKHAPTETSPPIMNASRPIIEGIEKTFGSDVPIIGAGLIGDFGFNPTRQFCCSYVGSQSVIGTLLSGAFTPYYRIMHGCSPQDGIYHTITKMEGASVYELDGKPIVRVIDDLYGNRDWRKQLPVRRLTIGVNYGDKFETYKEENFVNRLITGTLPDDEGIVLFEPDLEEGTEILFMLRSAERMMESVRKNSVDLIKQIKTDEKTPIFGLYIDCAGRSAAFSETVNEESSEIQRVFNQYDLPLLGFYSGVEVAPLLGKSRGLDWTGVLLVLAEG